MTKKSRYLVLYLIVSLVLILCGIMLEQLLGIKFPNVVFGAFSDAYWVAVGASLSYFFVKGQDWIK